MRQPPTLLSLLSACFDILFNNTSDIQPDVHSTDTHGTNAVNVAILHLFGYQFAPRYRDIYGTVRTSLYGFQHPSQYDDEMVLKPRRKLNATCLSLLSNAWWCGIRSRWPRLLHSSELRGKHHHR